MDLNQTWAIEAQPQYLTDPKKFLQKEQLNLWNWKSHENPPKNPKKMKKNARDEKIRQEINLLITPRGPVTSHF